MLFLPASILVILTAHTQFRPSGSSDEPRRDYYVANELRQAVKELQAVKEQLGSTVPAHGLSGSAASSAAPARTIGSAPSEQPEAVATAWSSPPDLLHELQQAQVSHQQTQQLLLRHIHDTQRSAHGTRAATAVAAAAQPPSPPAPQPALQTLPLPPRPPPLLHGAPARARERDSARSSEPTTISEDLIRLDDVGLEGILGELSDSTRRESSTSSVKSSKYK